MFNKTHKAQKVIVRNLPNKLANKDMVMMVNMWVGRGLKLPVRHQRHLHQVSKGQRSSMLRCMAWILVLLLRSCSQNLMKVLKGGLVAA
jgi:hypothetical protein